MVLSGPMRISKTFPRFLLCITVIFLLTACSKPKAGICSRCPVWFLDPICLTGGDEPDPEPPKPKTPPPVESNLVPGQERSIFHKVTR